MATNTHNFDKFVQEANTYLNKLASELGHPEEQGRTLKLWRAVMHTVRDRITVAESFDLMSQLPMLLKGIYAEQWKYHEKPPLEYDTMEEMKDHVKKLQDSYGESAFDWSKSTEELISAVLGSLNEYFTDGQMEHLQKQLPKEVKELAH